MTNTTKETTYLKNPKECVCVQTNKTFFICNELAAPEYTNGSEPLTFHHDTFSRFQFVIINEDKKAATANIGVRAIPGIIRKIQNLYLRETLYAKPVGFGQSSVPTVPAMPTTSAPSNGIAQDMPAKSLAYTTMITTGCLKGKTPASLLLEDAKKNKGILISQKKWLETNLSKYPRNKVQIEAIEDALKLYDAGKLSGEAMGVANEMNPVNSGRSSLTIGTDCQTEIVHDSGMRPLIRKKRADGKCPVYQIIISWNGGEKPIEIQIRNYYAPIEQKGNGLLSVKAAEREGEVRNKVSLTIDAWLWVAHILETNIRTFENLYAAKNYKRAVEEENRTKEMLKNGKL